MPLLFFLLAVLCSSPSFSQSIDNCHPDQFTLIESSCPMRGRGQLVQVDSSQMMWIKPTDNNSNLNLDRTMNNLRKDDSRNRSKGIKIKLLGVNNYLASINMSSNKKLEKEAFDFLADFLLGKEVTYTCFFIDKRDNLNCEVDYQDNDIGLLFIQKGQSPYYTKEGIHPIRNSEYKNAETKAKEEQVGVWGPFYGMFIFNKK